MLDTFMFVAFPYVALISLIIGVFYRFKYRPYGISAYSSQFLEQKKAFWGSLPWHIGVMIVFFFHLLALVTPEILRSITASDSSIIIVESVSLGAGILAFIGLLILFIRRILEDKLHVVTSKMDWIVILLVIVQIGIGISVAILHRWGAQWSIQTTTPYFWSIFKLNPNGAIMADMPILIKLHVFFAWFIVFLTPFSRLIHILTLPLEYYVRKPQIVIFNSRRKNNNL